MVVCVAGMDGALPTVVAGKEEGKEGGREEGGVVVCLLPWKRLEGRRWWCVLLGWMEPCRPWWLVRGREGGKGGTGRKGGTWLIV